MSRLFIEKNMSAMDSGTTPASDKKKRGAKNDEAITNDASIKQDIELSSEDSK